MNKLSQYELSSKEGNITVISSPLSPPFNEFLWTRDTGSCLWYKTLSQLWYEEKALKWWDDLGPVWSYFLKFSRIWDFEKTYTVPSFTGSKLCPIPWRTQKQEARQQSAFPPPLLLFVLSRRKVLKQLFSLQPDIELHITKTIKRDFQYRFANSTALHFGKLVFADELNQSILKIIIFLYVFKKVYCMTYSENFDRKYVTPSMPFFLIKTQLFS